MKIALITLFPEMFSALTDYGISGRAIKTDWCSATASIPEILPKIAIRPLMIAPTEADRAW